MLYQILFLFCIIVTENNIKVNLKIFVLITYTYNLRKK